jgi:hypothetical protein
MRAVRLWVVFLGGSPARSLLSRKVEHPCHRTFDSRSVPYTETGLEPLLARRREMITPVGWKIVVHRAVSREPHVESATFRLRMKNCWKVDKSVRHMIHTFTSLGSDASSVKLVITEVEQMV